MSNCVICICLFLAVNNLFRAIDEKVRQITIETSLRKVDSSYALSPLDKRKEQSLIQYFEWKRQNMRRSPFKTIVRNTFLKSSNKTSFLIYEYTSHRQFCKKQTNDLFYISTCPYKNCQFTCNSTSINRADVILMLYNQLNIERLFYLNKNRNLNQIWLLWHDESYTPALIYNKFLFNWTISYRFDSEISTAAYGIAFRKNKPMNQLVFDNWINKNYKKRRNEALWFVSNCRSKERLQYYEQLKEHFPISAFGKCIVNQKNRSPNCTRRSHCEQEKFFTSKFYLAFESTTSNINYITEKFWRSLSIGAIPIVIGPKRRDYERVAPPNSFIYAKDYSNPQTLAKYLNHIATNRNEYEKYHRWRINYETHYRATDLEPFRFCELCYRLNMNRDRIWYNDLNKYFSETDK